MNKDQKSLIAFIIGIVGLFLIGILSAVLIIKHGITSEGVGVLFGMFWIILPLAAVLLTVVIVIISAVTKPAGHEE